MNKEKLSALKADPGSKLYVLQQANGRDGSRILIVDDEGNKTEFQRYETLKEGQEVLSAYRESLDYIKH